MRKSPLLAVVLLALAGCSVLRPGPDAAPVFIVFFRYDGWTLSPDAHHIIDQAARAVQDTHPATIAIAAYGPGTATPEGRGLADLRFDAVADALAADGVDRRRMARVPLADNEASLPTTADRRVEIRLIDKTSP